MKEKTCLCETLLREGGERKGGYYLELLQDFTDTLCMMNWYWLWLYLRYLAGQISYVLFLLVRKQFYAQKMTSDVLWKDCLYL